MAKIDKLLADSGFLGDISPSAGLGSFGLTEDRLSDARESRLADGAGSPALALEADAVHDSAEPVTPALATALRETALAPLNMGPTRLGAQDMMNPSMAGFGWKAAPEWTAFAGLNGKAPGESEASWLLAVAAWKAELANVVWDGSIQRMAMPVDPFLASQWHLENTGAVPTAPPFPFGANAPLAGVDIDVLPVFADYTGAGIVVGVFDDGIDYDHADLAPNYDPMRHVSQNGIVNHPNVLSDWNNDSHGTSAAGLISMDMNAIGGVGVAPGATLVSIDLPFSNTSATLGHTFEGLVANWKQFDVTSNSWGVGASWFDNQLSVEDMPMFDALHDAVSTGRGGLGTVVVKSAGNSRGFGVDANTANLSSHRELIAVAALGHDGYVANYSSYSAGNLVSAPASRAPGPFTASNYGVLTADVQGTRGYQSGDYTLFNGTSAAAPIVAGVAALILDANPNLGWRDVHEIIAYSADHLGSATNAETPWAAERYLWQFNAASNWNGGGLHHSNDYGFGIADARAAVRLAETWQPTPSTSANEVSTSHTRTGLGLAIPDGMPNEGIAATFTLAAGVDIETVNLRTQITGHTYSYDLRVTLTSPGGTVSTLLDRTASGMAMPSDWVFNSQAFRGESSEGVWTVRVFDHLAYSTGVFEGATLTAFGAASSADSVYVYTDEFAKFYSVARSTLSDTAGTDTLNASALSGAAVINLNDGAASTIAGQTLTIASGTLIEKAFGGDGADTLTGNALANDLRGGRGDDSIDGGAGGDRLTGGQGRDSFAFEASGAGDDTITDFTVLHDTLVFAGAVSATANGLDLDADGRSDDARITHAGGQVILLDASYVARFGSPTASSDTILGSITADFIQGLEGDDSLGAGSGADSIDGGAGNDTIDGGADADTILGGDGDDSITVGSNGADEVHAGAGNDIVTVTGPGTLAFARGGAGTDTIAFVNAAGIAGFDGADFEFEAFAEGLAVNGTAAGERFDFSAMTGPAALSGVAVNGLGGNDTLLGAGGHDALTGSEGNDLIRGLAGADSMDGGAGNDWLIGSAGDDVLVGGSGDDTLDGGDGLDLYSGGEGLDVLDLSSLSDPLVVDLNGTVFRNGGLGNDTLSSIEGAITGSGSDTLYGTAAANYFSANGYNDLVIGSEGRDTILGGAGFDTLDYSSILAGVDYDMQTGLASVGGVAQLVSGVETVLMGGGNDTLRGTIFNDVLAGGAGDDVLMGGAGWDRFFGGLGNDTLVGGSDGGFLDRDYADYSAASAAVSVNLGTGSGTGVDIGLDTLVRINALSGGLGNDTLIGSSDYWYGTNELYGNAGDDFIDALGGNDLLYSGFGNDTALGGGGADYLDGDFGDDSLDGGAGTDSLYGSSGNDTLSGGLGEDQLQGAFGHDLVRGGWNSDFLDGREDDDTLEGNSGADYLIAGLGNDSVSGDAGNDYISYGSGNDTLSGGDGFDWLAFGSWWGSVWVNLATSVVNLGPGTSLTISGFEAVLGGSGNDILTAAPQAAMEASYADIVKASSIANTSIAAAVNLSGTFDLLENTSIFDSDSLPHTTVHGVFSSTAAGAREYYAFSVGAGVWGAFDIDGASFDTVVELYDSAGTLLASNDDAETDIGSTLDLDSFLMHNFSSAGTYYLAVRSFTGGVAPNGAYTLHVSLSDQALSATQAPAALKPSLEGGYGDDVLIGSASSDVLRGGWGSDIIDAGTGADVAWYATERDDAFVRSYMTEYGLQTEVWSEGIDTLFNVETLRFASESELYNGSGAPFSPSELFKIAGIQQNRHANVDGGWEDQIVLSHTGTGQAVYVDNDQWGAVIMPLLDAMAAGWVVRGTADVTGDGRSEVFVQNTANGALYAVDTASDTPDWRTISANLSADFVMIDQGDMTGDGTTDVLLRQMSTGAMVFADMGPGAVFERWVNAANFGTTEWRTIGLGDFSADGVSDIAIQNTFNGLTYYANFGMGGTLDSWGYIAGGLGTTWIAKAIADVNGDAHDDVIFQHSGDGTLIYTSLAGGTGGSVWGVIGSNLLGWSVMSTGDYDNDGYDDIALQNAKGTVIAADMDHGVFQDFVPVSSLGASFMVV